MERKKRRKKKKKKGGGGGGGEKKKKERKSRLKGRRQQRHPGYSTGACLVPFQSGVRCLHLCHPGTAGNRPVNQNNAEGNLKTVVPGVLRCRVLGEI